MLNLATQRNSPARSTKSTRSHFLVVLSLLVSIWFQVLFHSPPGVLFTFPSRYYTLSVIRSYLALGDGPPAFPPNFSCSMVLWILTILNSVSTTRILRSSSALSNALRLLRPIRFVSPNPSRISTWGLGSYPFARHYSGNRCFTFSSSGYLDVSVPRVPLRTLSIHLRIPYISIRCVPAFGYLRINAHLQLPAAFRSLSRPSSALSAKASSIRSSSLNHSEITLVTP